MRNRLAPIKWGEGVRAGRKRTTQLVLKFTERQLQRGKYFCTTASLALEKIGADDKAWEVMTMMGKVYNNRSCS